MEAQQQFDKIESYLTGGLTGAELSSFEQQLQTDSALAAEVEEHRIAHDAVEMLIEQDLRKELEALRAASTSSASPKVVQMPQRAATTTARRRSLFPRLAAAASVVLLIGFFTLQYNGSSSTSFDQQFAEYQMPEVIRGNDPTDLHPLAKGLEAYKAGNYEEAISYYQSIATDDKRYNEAQFYLGHSFSKNKEYTAAVSTFEKIAKSGDIRYIEKAEWYQLLALLANQQQDEQFTTLLNKMLTDKNHSYHQQAQNLKADL